MVSALLVRGMLVGFLAGLLVFTFAKVFGEPQVDRAIAFESAMDEAKMKADLAKGIHDMEEPELVSRPMQASWGLLTGVMTYCTAFGGLFALVFAFAYGRVSGLSPRAVSALLALTGIIALYIVPNLKYPANPPSVGHPDTIGILYRSLFCDDGPVGRGDGRRGDPAQTSRAQTRCVDGGVDRIGRLHCGCDDRGRAFAADQRSPQRFPGCRALALPHRLTRHASNYVGDVGLRVWRIDRAGFRRPFA